VCCRINFTSFGTLVNIIVFFSCSVYEFVSVSDSEIESIFLFLQIKKREECSAVGAISDVLFVCFCFCFCVIVLFAVLKN